MTSRLIEIINNKRINKIGCDIIIESIDGSKSYAHSSILTLVCSYFRALISFNSKKKDNIDEIININLAQYNHDAIESALEYIYLDKISNKNLTYCGLMEVVELLDYFGFEFSKEEFLDKYVSKYLAEKSEYLYDFMSTHECNILKYSKLFALHLSKGDHKPFIDKMEDIDSLKNFINNLINLYIAESKIITEPIYLPCISKYCRASPQKIITVNKANNIIRIRDYAAISGQTCAERYNDRDEHGISDIMFCTKCLCDITKNDSY